MDESDLVANMINNEAVSVNQQTGSLSWLTWCRLCAKRNEAGQENSMVFGKDMNSTLTTSIGKYFWVNIKPEDEIPKSLCRECEKLIDELVAFTERVNKVQTMYCLLQNLKSTSLDAANKLRSHFGVADESWEHIIKVDKPPLKPDVANREVQTDLVIFFNHHSQEVKKNDHTEFTNEDSEKLAKEQPHEDEEFVADIDHEQGQTYEYILNGDNDDGDGDTISYSEEGIKFKLSTVSTGVDDEADIEDSDLFKELKFKTEDNDEEYVKKDLSNVKKVQLEIRQMGDNSDTEATEVLEEDADEVGDDEDYIEILDFKSEHNAPNSESNEYDLIPKRKRGRPRNSSNPNGTMADSPYRYDCPDCKRKYKNPTVFRKHMLINHGAVVGQLPDFLCSVCNTDCLTKSALKKHMRKHLSDDEKFTVSCPFCDKKFSQEGAMKQHVDGIHRQMKPFICDQCGRACKTLAALNEHQLVHTNECPCICDVCKKGFKNKARLKYHMDTHTETEYSCPDCNLKLNTKRTLLQHRLVHSNVKRFKCQFCDSAFKRSKALKNHLILHTGLRPYKCPFCEKSFSNGSNCRSHKKRAHPKELAQEEALGKKSEPIPIPKLEDLKAAKGIVQPRKVKRHGGLMTDHLRHLLNSGDQSSKQTVDDFGDVSAEENFEIADIEYEIEGELEDDDDVEEESQDFVDDCEETVIYEIIGEV